MTMADVTIMGAGVFGLTVALACADRGARVRVIEKRAPGAGSSGGIVGALAPHVPENWNAKKAMQFEALRMAEHYWADIAARGGVDPGYARTGRVQPLAHGAVDLARSREAQARDLWQGFATWRVLPVADAPGLAVDAPSGFVVHDTLTARLHPRRAGAALVAALSAQGVTVEQGDSPQGGTVIWATGYEGLADLSRDLARNMGGGVKGQSLLLAHAAPNLPQVFAEGLHIVPHADGTVAIGSTSEREFDAPDTTDAQCEALLARARAACPELAKAAVIARWAGVRPRAQSRAPLMGAWPGRDGHFVFNGGFKIGFAMAPALAQIMADLVLDRRDRVPDGFGLVA
ncbi:Glycine/D-amino acid oxidase (deaminating) [Roseibaca calidilacus]|uniref:Glycine/D-amino acid oxidase (Deaminating) n=2 Tax=Roseibaca calidilacus TaxID=1666912 RepID=A0ABP2BWE6_9RHOB|nr:FAD-binding oxidoreductase [Roseibaca calidilacus]CUX80475.1 Glycine/D-amino acid oxidase (deaminating) [Roseibaca calidilacus]